MKSILAILVAIVMTVVHANALQIVNVADTPTTLSFEVTDIESLSVGMNVLQTWSGGLASIVASHFDVGSPAADIYTVGFSVFSPTSERLLQFGMDEAGSVQFYLKPNPEPMYAPLTGGYTLTRSSASNPRFYYESVNVHLEWGSSARVPDGGFSGLFLCSSVAGLLFFGFGYRRS